MKKILTIKNLTICAEKKIVVSNLNLTLNIGEIHIIMGANGSGKSSLAKAIVGHPVYKISTGSIKYKNKNLLKIDPTIRAQIGIFLAFQNPMEIPGITNYEFLRLMYNQKQQFLKKLELTPLEFFKYLKNLLYKLGLNLEFLTRNVNENFSGGEKKCNELLQLLLLEPSLVIFDEIDSGMDFDLINLVFNILFKTHFKNTTFLIITHNPSIVSLLSYSKIHILNKGKLCQSGKIELLNEIKTNGYTRF